MPAPDQQRYANSGREHQRAAGLMPGGVSSPVRAYKAVGRTPVTVSRGEGANITDVDDNTYIDYVGSYGPLILGHAHPATVRAVQEAAAGGTSFGAPTRAESELAELIIQRVPGVELVRMVNSGTEACMSALRLARAATGRPLVVKCTGCYHGHSDPLLVQAGSGATTLGTPSSPGVPGSVVQTTLLAPFNDLEAAAALFADQGQQIAAMIVEPIAGNMGCVPPAPGYLQGLRDLCDRHGALLVFDEVMTGFRVAPGGAQQLYGVRPDLTCLGKVVGGGLPCAAYGGREDLMRQVAPDGPVYQAGTLSGNPLAMAAGLATLRALGEPGVYDHLEAVSDRLAQGLSAAAEHAGRAVSVQRVGSMVCCFFSDRPVRDYAGATGCDTAAFGRFFGRMLDGGVLLPPSQFETWFVSTAHDTATVDRTLEVVRDAMACC